MSYITRAGVEEMSDTNNSELRNKLFALWRAGRDGDDRYIAVDEIEALITQQCNQARIDELSDIYDKRQQFVISPAFSLFAVYGNDIKKRIIELTALKDKETTE